MRSPPFAANRNRLSVLGYHNVAPTWRFPAAPGSGVRTFARQMRFLKQTTTMVPLDEALDALQAGRPLPPRAVAITFDDGYRDNLTLAVPVLQRLKIPASIFLVPGFLSGHEHAWWERLGWAMMRSRAPALDFEGRRLELSTVAERRTALAAVEESVKRLDHAARQQAVERVVAVLEPEGTYHADALFMNWDDARSMVRAGISIGSHTMRHAILAREADKTQREDLSESRRLLESELQTAVRTLAYPNGQADDYDAGTGAAARAAGYSHAFAAWGCTSCARTPPYEMRRRMVSTDRPASRLVVNVMRDLLGSTTAGGEGHTDGASRRLPARRG
jgi:peptidoglycan/xylan/chitin deacetylase (PgdA/CDA1 family)